MNRSHERLSFRVIGKGEPTLVLVHGWPLDSRMWDAQLPALSKRHQVITLDLATNGSGGRERQTIAAFGRIVRDVVHAAEANQVVLVGHSMGGNVVLEAARQIPERIEGLVMVDTLLDVEQRIPSEEIDAIAHRLDCDYKAAVTQHAEAYLLLPTTPTAVRDHVLRGATAMQAEISIALMRQVWSYDPLPALRQIKAPIRAVNTDRILTNVEGNRRHMPGYEVVIVKGTGHYPMLEDPVQFNRALDEAIAKVLLARRMDR